MGCFVFFFVPVWAWGRKTPKSADQPKEFRSTLQCTIYDLRSEKPWITRLQLLLLWSYYHCPIYVTITFKVTFTVTVTDPLIISVAPLVTATFTITVLFTLYALFSVTITVYYYYLLLWLLLLPSPQKCPFNRTASFSWHGNYYNGISHCLKCTIICVCVCVCLSLL